MTDTQTSNTPASNTPASTTTTVDTPAPTVWPTLQAHDALALIDFYVDVFGFVATAVYADGDTVAHAQLDWPEGGGIMLGSHQPDADWNREPGTFGAYVVTDHVDELYARVQAARSATVRRELRDESYGNREFSVSDPEGNLWSFGSYRGEGRS
ncbi:MAG: VOC family protein [Propionibacteriaceae bacterium]